MKLILVLPVTVALAVLALASCGMLGSGVSTSGSLASRGSGAGSGSLPGIGGGGGKTGRICGSRAIQGQVIPNVEGPGECGVDGAVLVQSVSGVVLSPPPTMTCETAEALNNWVSDGVEPLVSQTGDHLEGLQVAAHFACRGMNGQSAASLSEHAFGRAIDISGFRFERAGFVSVGEDWSSAEQGPLLREIYASACGAFATTLGPGSDGYHQNHFHLDNGGEADAAVCR